MRPHVVALARRLLAARASRSALAPSWFTCVGLAGPGHAARDDRWSRDAAASTPAWSRASCCGATSPRSSPASSMPMVIDAVGAARRDRPRPRAVGRHDLVLGLPRRLAPRSRSCAARTGCSLARFGDLAAAPLGLALVFARLGCFLGGCDYGKVTSVPWAVRFPSGKPGVARSRARGPGARGSRGVAAGAPDAALRGGARPRDRGRRAVGRAPSRGRARARGRVFLAAAATYALGRIGIEALRGDLGRGIYAGLSSGQIFSIVRARRDRGRAGVRAPARAHRDRHRRHAARGGRPPPGRGPA